MRKRNLWEKKETGRNIAIERGRQEENMEMEGKEVKAEAPGKRGRQEESMEMEGKEVKAEMAEKEKKKKRMILIRKTLFRLLCQRRSEKQLG